MAEPTRMAEGQLSHPPTISRAARATQVTQDRDDGADGMGRAYAPCRGGGCTGIIPTPLPGEQGTDAHGTSHA
eukprot:6190209-Pleurochrysis_carterae.AAC.1